MAVANPVISQVKLGDDTADITEEDLIWIVRGTAGETISAHRAGQAKHELENAALISCFVQRWMLLRKRSSAWRNKPLGDLAQAHSVPINPGWLPGGAQYQRWVGRDPQTTPERVAARRRRRAAPLSSFDRKLVELARDLLTGRKPLVESGHEWGAVSLYDERWGIDVRTDESRRATAPDAVRNRESARGAAYRAKGPEYVHIPGQHRLGNVFSTYNDASYASIVGGVTRTRVPKLPLFLALVGIVVSFAGSRV